MTEPLKDSRETILIAHLFLVMREKLNLVCLLLHSCLLVEAQYMLLCMNYLRGHVFPNLELKNYGIQGAHG